MNSTADKKRNETADRTNPLYANMTYASTFQRKNSQSRSTASNISNRNSYQISAQSLMPCLQRMKCENQHYSQQKNKMCHELNLLQDLTQQLLSENEALRLHYAQRSNDVKNIIQTFSNNVNEQLSEMKHLIHFYREHNVILTKQIQQITNKTNNHHQIINRASKQLIKLTGQNSKLQENLRKREVINKVSQKNIQKLQKATKQSKLQELQKQICNLHLDNNLMKKKNIATIKYIRQQKLSLNADRPQIKNLAVEAIKSVKMLKEQLELITRDLNNYSLNNDALANNEQSIVKNFYALLSKTQNKRSKLLKLNDKKKQLEETNTKLINSNQVLKLENNKKETEKNNLQKLVEKKKAQIINININQQKKKTALNEQYAQKIGKIKEEIRKNENSLTKAIFQQLNPEKESSQNLLVSLKNELQILNKQAEEGKTKVNSLQNPLRQIMKIQFQMKQLKKN